jgi:selenocysteine lyase/cysteine desulfurase
LSSSLNVEAIREQVPACGKYIYLNSGWQGPSPASVIHAVQAAFQDEAEGPTAPPTHERRLTDFRRSRRALADLIGASADEVSIQQNTTEGVNIVLSGIGLQPGDEIITCGGEHSSVIVPAYHARDRYGVTLKIVRVTSKDTPGDIVARFAEAATSALRLILLSHISYSSGQLFPVRELAALAHQHGGRLLLDAAQSVGQMPVNVRELECDYCAFPGHKWLLGPAATGALYVRRGLIESLNPPRVSHHASSFYNFKDRFEAKTDTIDKFELTTVSVPLLAGLNAAIAFIEAVGLESIRDRAVALAGYATERLSAVEGVEMVSASEPSAVCSGMVSFALSGVSPAMLTAHLWESRRIVARTVPDAACTRLCFHVFNTEAEVDAAVEAVAEVAKHGLPDREYPSIQTEWEAMVEL